jgi:hypothetical protein
LRGRAAGLARSRIDSTLAIIRSLRPRSWAAADINSMDATPSAATESAIFSTEHPQLLEAS